MKIEPATATYPLSSLQQGMLFHSVSAQQPGVDVEQIFCTLHEELNATVFQLAWRCVIERHAVLRTSFHWQESAGPLQKVHQHVECEFSRQDWRDVARTKHKPLFTGWLEAERTRGFDPGQAPLMRLALFHNGENEWQFLWTFHHLLLDGRAVVTLLNEVFAFYEAFNNGEDLELPTPRPYHDFIDWLPKQNLIKAENFWRQTLKGFEAPTPLVVASRTNQGAEGLQIRGEQQIRLSRATTTALKLAAKENRLTLNTMVQGAWALLLSRYSGEEDVLFGAVRAGRHATIEGAESIVGLCINTVPVRVRVPAGELLWPWLAGLRNAWIALRDYEHTPLVKIQGWSEVPPGQPLFESILNFQDPSWDTVLCAQGGKWATREFGICSQSNYPLVVDAYGGDAMLIKILYHRTRFDDASIERMLGHFKTLLEGMVENPRQQLSDLPLLTEAERRQLLVDWNHTGADFPKDKRVHELFEEQVERTPGALAVSDKATQLTYRELNERADRLASKLREIGVGPDVCAGICMARGVDMVTSKLAVWKAGGAYVPLDPSHPEDRLAFMLQDAKMPVLLTRKSLGEHFKFQISNFKLLCVDTLLDQTGNKPDEPIPQSPTGDPQPGNLAYVIYTSGSTGTPKGVEIEHASLVNLIAWHQRTYSVTPADRATQIATPAFDASVWELWPYLTSGASVHIPDEETRFSARKLVRWLADEKITLTFVPTPIAENLLDEPWPANCAVRAVLTGGDKLHRAPGKDFPCALLNHYGPTENAVVTTWSPVPPVDENAPPPLIGRPIANTQVYILDRNLQPVPIGVPGELHISGVGLARGYRNRPELTGEKFIPNAFSAEPGSRLYKTGDLVRWRPDGQIEFLGRMDNQIKIRGQRIELGEIETILVRHPGVRESAVIPRENINGENRLVAYVVPGVEIKTGELRRFLHEKLPGAMVPSEFIFLPALPLTRNGKIDHKALPLPDLTAESEKPSTTPHTPTETTLTGIWSEVLGVGHISLHDNFFELGGHSLMATQVISRIFRAFQIEMPLHELFDSPTIAGLAEKIDARCGARPSLASSQKQSECEDTRPISFAQERLWFMEQLEPGQPFNNIPAAFRLEGVLNLGALEKSITEIIRRHATLRTAFGNENGQPAAVLAPAKEMKIPVIDLGVAPDGQRETEARQLMSAEAQQPFDLAQSPLLRVKLLRFAAEEHLLLLTLHHIACDGWSMGVFYRELAALYQACSQGRPSPLPELEFDYSNFARLQRERLQDEPLEKKLAGWKRQLAGAPTILDLPTDRPRPAVQTYHGAAKHFALPKNLSGQLAELSRKENVTPFMLLLAAFQTLLHRYSGQEDILVGSPVAGRTRVETEGLIGFFLNTLVLRGDLSGNPPFRELLKRTRKTVLDAFAYQDLPFEKIVEALQPARDVSRPPLFQVMFVLQNEPLRPPDLPGLKLTPLSLHSGTAKFDLMFSLEESEGGLSGFIEYNRDLFNAETIAQFLGNYQTLLESITAGVEQRLSQLPLLAEAERKEILIKWNDTGAEFSKDKCVHQLFEEQVERTPDAVAVVFEDEQLTYRELNGWADQLAHKLRELGVGPDMRAGICLKRSLAMMAGLLGILKAGGCYVPLDPAYPKERLAFMLEDSQASVLLTQESLRPAFNFKISNLKIVDVDTVIRHPPSPAGEPDLQSKICNPQAGSLAYVIYTSGSTGKPKGVMVTHRNVVNFFAGMDRVLGTEPGTWLAVTSISFDISVLELFWTLVRGFKVVIQPDYDHTLGVDGDSVVASSPDLNRPMELSNPSTTAKGQWRPLPEQILRHNVTHLQCTPSLARTFVLAPESLAAMRHLGKLLLGGEALPVSLSKQLREVLRGDLINMYGPTETTVWSAAYRVDETGNSVPIGRPIANTQIYILDKHFQPVPAGVPGEIDIGGEGVARGYLNRPELTADKFIRDPFSPNANARLYRTGDLGRFRADGVIEFLGRLDHQVKIRGHRIELGEIELALSRHPGVREIVAVAHEDTPGDKRLVAYVVAAPDAKPSATELRRYAQEKLPAAMTPDAFVFLDTLPLTPNGKVNRKALPAGEIQRPQLEAAYVAPQSKLEKSIAKIWQELLRINQAGLHDNFFDLGGNSLLVVQAQARLRDTLGLDLPVVKLFQHPTIGALANFLSAPEPPSFEKAHQRARRKQSVFARHTKHEHEIMG